MIEDTSKRDSFTNLVGLVGMGNDAYITGMEAAGQAQLVAATSMMPADGDWDALAALGFGAPEPTDDELFVKTTLPTGWSKGATEHDMHSSVLDERGVERVSVFYKAAFYDRRASFHVTNVGHSLSISAIYGEDEPALPSQWGVLTDEERGQFVRSLEAYMKQVEEHPDIYGKRAARVEALQKLVDEAA
jgi:hypothetical protein